MHEAKLQNMETHVAHFLLLNAHADIYQMSAEACECCDLQATFRSFPITIPLLGTACGSMLVLVL